MSINSADVVINYDVSVLEDRILASMGLDKESLRKADHVSEVYGLTWPSSSSTVSFFDLVEQGCSEEEARYAVELATGEKAIRNIYHQPWQEAKASSWGIPKQPKKKLPYYQGKRRF